MNNELPIVVKPSRFLWGMLVLGMAGFFVIMILTAGGAVEEWTTVKTLLAFVVIALIGWRMLVAAWVFIAVPSVIVIDENGVNGRLSPFHARTIRIPWEDIVGADFESQRVRTFRRYGWGSHTEIRYLRLFVDNTSGKYHRASRSPDEAKAPGEERDIRVIEFITNLSKASEGRTQEIAGVIDNLAKTTLAERQKMTKSPFATDE